LVSGQRVVTQHFVQGRTFHNLSLGESEETRFSAFAAKSMRRSEQRDVREAVV
jgi:hypothetical protein